MYFIGVTTGASSIQKIFSAWARLAGAADAELVGADIPVGGRPESYRSVVAAIRDDPGAMGALVTTHKVGLWQHARDLFTDFDSDAELLGEVSCIVRRTEDAASRAGGHVRMTGMAIDTLTGGLALRALVGAEPFRGQALIMGAGGAATALAVHLHRHHSAKVILTDIAAGRLDHAGRLTLARTVRVAGPEDHDHLIGELPPGSLIVNATGVGKDRPGSPVTPRVHFPENAIAWDFNYRGDLQFLDHARAQGVRAVDGWEYFLHGWSQIMARVLGFDLTPELFGAMREIADAAR